MNHNENLIFGNKLNTKSKQRKTAYSVIIKDNKINK